MRGIFFFREIFKQFPFLIFARLFDLGGILSLRNEVTFEGFSDMAREKLREYYIWRIKKQIKDIRQGGVIAVLQKFWRFIELLPSILLRLITTIPLLPIIFFIRLISSFVMIRFGFQESGRLGHYASRPEIYLCERDAGLHPRSTIDIFYNDNELHICNYQLKKMWERTLHFSKLARYLYMANYLLPGYKKHIVPLPSLWDIHGYYDRFPPHLSFTSEEEKKGYEELYKIGIPEGAKFICFHARDSAYRKKTYYLDYRNADIDNFIPAAEELVKRGYYALRMGALHEKALKINNPRIIDYTTKFRTEFLDIYLTAKCEFFIATSTGIVDVAMAFRKPVVHVNFIPVEHVPSWSSKIMVIFKKLWLRKERRFMTFREILESGVGSFNVAEQYEQHDIEVIENTPEEIRAVAVEMDERLKGSWQTNEEYEDLQQRFWSLFTPSELHRIFTTRVGSEFLRQNQDLLN